MIEDREVIMDALCRQRDVLDILLDTKWAAEKGQASRIRLARINAEIARRCWNRIAIHAARSHSPIEDRNR
jgi:hypothetical protein